MAYVLPSFLASHHDRHAWHMRSYHDQSRQASLSLFSLFFLRLTWARLRKEAHLDHARGENMAVALYDGTRVSHSKAWDYEEKQ